MERKDFLKGISIAGAAALFPFKHGASAASVEGAAPTACTLIPSETRGPYPLPAATNVSTVTRANITEGKTGVPLTLTILVQNTNCTPIPGARVDIWHCDKDGYYSGYGNQPGINGTQNYTGATWMRGSLTTGSDGKVIFTTIYPGWYTGRITHIHAEIYIGGTLMRTSQYAFDPAVTTAVYNSALYVAHGQNSSVASISADNVFSDGSSGQMLQASDGTLSGSVAAGYAANHTFTLSYSIVPLTLLSFNGSLENGYATLWWATANELNTDHFEIEKSSNGIDFSRSGTLAAASRSGENQYSFTDPGIDLATTYYRLKMVDRDGAFTYSTILKLIAGDSLKITAYPSPASKNIQLNHPKTDNNSYVEIISTAGQSVAYTKLPAGSLSTAIDVSNLSKGLYLLCFLRSGARQTIKFLKN